MESGVNPERSRRRIVEMLLECHWETGKMCKINETESEYMPIDILKDVLYDV